MKTSKRLLISSATMLALSAVALSTGTYAWFTSNRKAQLQVTNIAAMAAKSLNVSATIQGGGVDSATALTFDADNKSSYSDTLKVTDVSSKDGVDGSFFKQNLTNIAQYYAVANSATNSHYYIDVAFTFTFELDTDIYSQAKLMLDANTKIESVTGALTPAYRVALLNEEKTAAHTAGLLATDRGGDFANAITSTAGATDSQSKVTYDENGEVTLATWTAASNELKVVARIWLEGTDNACKNENVTGTTKITFAFRVDETLKA